METTSMDGHSHEYMIWHVVDSAIQTPEKWYVGYDQEYDIDAGDDGRTIGYPTGRDEFDGTVFMVDGEDQIEIIAEQIRDERTAHLIAAAPEMLSMLLELQECAGYWSEYDVPLGLKERLDTAIRKARGEE
jgi:hypothetical protein